MAQRLRRRISFAGNRRGRTRARLHPFAQRRCPRLELDRASERTLVRTFRCGLAPGVDRCENLAHEPSNLLDDASPGSPLCTGHVSCCRTAVMLRGWLGAVLTMAYGLSLGGCVLPVEDDPGDEP